MARRNATRFEVTPTILLRAYACGIFPMAESADDPAIHWIDPAERGVLDFEAFHIPRSLRKTIRRQPFEMRYDTAFAAVVDGCAEPGPGRPQTWINADIRCLYLDLYRGGHAHSVESWDEGQLVGGLYGVSLGAAFFGESMFSRATDASKVALAYLVDRLRHGGYRLLDTQFLNPHLVQFGVREIPRAEYQKRLETAIAATATFQPLGGGTVESVLQPFSHTS